MAEKHLSGHLRELVMHQVEGESVYRRIEDASGNLGTPDVWIIAAGVEMWVELKHTETPGAKPKMRPGQRGFAKAVRRAGGRAWRLASNDRDNNVRLWLGNDKAEAQPLYEGPLDLNCWHLMAYG